jgi:hypothetical protein
VQFNAARSVATGAETGCRNETGANTSGNAQPA